MTHVPVMRRTIAWARHVAGGRRDAGLASAGAVALLLGVAALVPRHLSPEAPTALVTREPFEETIVESGTIGAERLMIYGSSIAGAQAKIVEIVPEGAAVHAGDLLVRFDASGFEQALARERAALGQAEAGLLGAREELRLDRLRAEGELDAARGEVSHAEHSLVNQLEGKGRLEIAEADLAAADAARELERARTAVGDLKPLLAEGFVTRAEVTQAEQALARAEEQQRLADARRDTLVKYERPAATSLARSEVASAHDGLARQRETAAARRSEREAAVTSAVSRVDEIRARVAILEQQIASTTVRAAAPGLVVYRDLYFGSDRRKPQVGDEVWPNQPLIAVPDSSQLTVETRIREIDLHRIAASQRVAVTVDAYPDIRLPASVMLVGALAEDDAARAGTKFFPVTIKLLAADARLRTGMTAQVEIEVKSIPRALTVPLQAVIDDRGTTYVLIDRRGTIERRTVKLAGANDMRAALAGGVAEGERVRLVDPSRP